MSRRSDISEDAQHSHLQAPPLSAKVLRCPVCNDLDYCDHPDLESDDGVHFGISYNDLANDCQYCRLLKSMVSYFGRGNVSNIFVEIEEDKPIGVHISYRRPLHRMALAPSWDEADTSQPLSHGFFFYAKDTNTALPKLTTYEPYLDHMDLETAVGFIKERLSECLQSHKYCGRKLRDQPLPQRVLHIGTSDGDPINLIDSSSTGLENSRYITLSHCWGAKQPATTTLSNIDDRMRGITFHDLPIVFQQAISITRGLGVSYIWIDSLCIIQDSQEDWERESSRMCEYYRNSSFTIATASSPDSTVPFLGLRDETWLPVEFRFAGTVIYAQKSPVASEDSGQLFTRAWTWQESVLSSRTIYFTPSDLIWECRTQYDSHHYRTEFSEHSHLGLSWLVSGFTDGDKQKSEESSEDKSETGDLSYDDSRSIASHQSFQRSINSDGADISENSDSSEEEDEGVTVRRQWNTLVKRYTRRKLTFLEDKLPALSGVASLLHKKLCCEYYAGLWENGLEKSLCWQLEDNDTQRLGYQPRSFVAPSWSWASITQAVEPYLDEFEDPELFDCKFVIEEVDTQTPGLNPFGRVTSGHLIVSGRVAEVYLECVQPFKRYSIHDPRDVEEYRRKRAIRRQETPSYDYEDEDEDELHDPTEHKPWAFNADCVLLLDGDGKAIRAHDGQAVGRFKTKALCLYLGMGLFEDASEQYGIRIV
ncbi:heterokaryon incompatibility protein-domain-containing protein [Xylariales sp. PMI_506]|nr:heterokaryon incompatibility protein-domain-containing protein [Xylariales sp. PMI_506]